MNDELILILKVVMDSGIHLARLSMIKNWLSLSYNLTQPSVFHDNSASLSHAHEFCLQYWRQNLHSPITGLKGSSLVNQGW
jgi:hypothetical protein